MWAVETTTPYKAAGAWSRNKDGVHEWIVALKATFDIRSDGMLLPAEEQAEPLLLPEFNGEIGRSSLRYDADLVSLKPTTDLLINGTAYAPGGRASGGFTIAARVGPIRKELRAIGNRRWKAGTAGASPSSIEPVAEIPLLYEHAYGGHDAADPDPRRQRLDPRNPVGCGLFSEQGRSLPNFEYSDGDVDKMGPAGFGAIADYWSPRRELGGTYDDAWQKSRYPLLPADWDANCLQCSPGDQRPKSHLVGGEQVELVNLTRSGTLRFSLPNLRFACRTTFDIPSRERTREHSCQLSTVIIEPDYQRVILVWQSVLTCPRDADYLDITVVSEAE